MRADRLLVERGVFASRARAQAAIAAGLVRADNRILRKASEEIATDAIIDAQPEHPYVSRGGVKLAAALDHFGFDPAERICLDVGASTGGFTDVLLKRGARRVYAIDVGQRQLHPSLQGHPSIASIEQTDIRRLDSARITEPVDLITIDVSFISLSLVLAPALQFAATHARLIALIKPQFEVGRVLIKKGIVRDADAQRAACDNIAARVSALGWSILGVIPSPIAGGDGNREFLLGAQRD